MFKVHFIVLLHHKKIEDERINTKNYRLSEELQPRDIHERPDGWSYSRYCAHSLFLNRGLNLIGTSISCSSFQTTCNKNNRNKNNSNSYCN